MTATTSSETSSPTKDQIVTPIILGLLFGFLLQKGGAAQYHIIMGSLLLQDFTVWKIMLSAILVGMIALALLQKYDLIDPDVKPTRLGSNIIGGLIFGVGFALIGYCPGTGAAAVGQGNFDAIFGVVGLIAGSYLYAEISGWSKNTIEKWGDCGELTLQDLFKTSKENAVKYTAISLVLVLVVLSLIFER
jgi:uncharacterized protein